MPKITVPAAVWQWDINDTITVEGIEDISKWQVHFATVGDSNALVLEINPDMTCYIPNQLVELGQAIYAYLYNVEEQRAYTETAVLISVKARPRPLDYISTPTDVLTWGQLRADIGTLSQLATKDKTNLVAAVNELHGDIETAYSKIDSIETGMTEQGQSITAIQSGIKKIEQSIANINDTDAAQSQAISQAQEDIDELERSDTQLTKSVSSLAQTVDKGFKQVQTELDQKQPVGDYITNAVDNLVNYYLKSETYTRSEVKDLIGSLTHINIKIVSSIDDVTEPNVIYLAPASSGKSDDYYNEYILVNGSPELIGNTRVDLSDYYTREQTDDLLNKKQPVGNYVKSVNGNAPDEGGNVEIDVQTYTAGEGIDISDSGEIAVTNPMDDEQVSTETTWSSAKIISSVSQPISESGSIITCYPVEGSPLHVVSDITAVQEGTGDPSPNNVKSIKGYEKALLTQCGKNFLNLDNCTLANCNIANITNSSIQCAINDHYFSSIRLNDMPINNTAITFSQKQILSDKQMTIVEHGITTTESSRTNANYVTKELEDYVYKGNSYHIELRTNRSGTPFTDTTTIIDNLQLEVGTVATPFEPYRGQTYTADFPETVYGGTLDWTTGVLTVTWVKADLSQPYYYPSGGNGVRFSKALDDSYNSNTPALCSHGLIVKNISTHGFIIGVYNSDIYAIGLLDDLGLSSIEEYKTWAESNTIELYYKTNRPYIIQLTPAQILAISGQNTIYCDTGDVTVTGYEDPRHTVAQLTQRIAALESAATGI